MKYVKLILLTLGISIALVSIRVVVSADQMGDSSIGQNTSDQYDELTEIEKKKAELEAKIAQLKNEQNTLANQMSYLESQINLTLIKQDQTRAQIEETQRLLEEVNTDIDGLSEKLGNLDGSIDELYEVLAARVRLSYQLESTGGGYLLDTYNSQQVILQTAYLQTLQKEDKRLLSKMNDTRDVYQIQKTKLEGLKKDKEELKVQLETQNQVLGQQKIELDNQQNAKAWLLQVTRNEENQYQILLAQTEEEIRAIKAALANLGTKLGEVKQGDVIAHLGNTGCSTGPHLHFAYYVNGVATDPNAKLNSGAFIWPVNNVYITQQYGANYDWYMQNFGMPGHNGIDMVDSAFAPGQGAPILAAADGTAYRVSDNAACWLTGTVGQGIRIDHPDGTKTIYWHIQ